MTTESSTTTANNNAAPIVTTDVQPIVDSPIVAVVPSDPVVSPEPVVPDPALDPEPAAAAAQDAVQKRINELTAKRYEAERKERVANDAKLAAEAKSAELLAQLATRQPSADLAQSAAGPSKEEIEKLVAERALQIAAANEFNKACDNIADTGKAAYTDWDDALKNLTMVGAIGKDASPDFIQTAIELKSAHKILHHLGKNLDEAERIAKLPPVKMAMEMARIEAQLNAPTPSTPPIPVSGAPAPVITVGGSAKPGTLAIDDPNISMEEFNALRNRQAMERRERYRRTN